MRKFLSKKAGATFPLETPYTTIVPRKDGIEIICKISSKTSEIYGIVTLARVDEKNGILFVNWGNYFDILKNLNERQILELESKCPELFDLTTGNKNGVNIMSIGHGDDPMEQGIGMDIELPSHVPLLFCIDKKLGC